MPIDGVAEGKTQHRHAKCDPRSRTPEGTATTGRGNSASCFTCTPSHGHRSPAGMRPTVRSYVLETYAIPCSTCMQKQVAYEHLSWLPGGRVTHVLPDTRAARSFTLRQSRRDILGLRPTARHKLRRCLRYQACLACKTQGQGTAKNETFERVY